MQTLDTKLLSRVYKKAILSLHLERGGHIIFRDDNAVLLSLQQKKQLQTQLVTAWLIVERLKQMVWGERQEKRQ